MKREAYIIEIFNNAVIRVSDLELPDPAVIDFMKAAFHHYFRSQASSTLYDSVDNAWKAINNKINTTPESYMERKAKLRP